MTHDFLEVAAITDVGSVRQYNEDSIAVDAANGILALADGMGGHRAGEVASRMATEVLMTGLVGAIDRHRPDEHRHFPLLELEQSIKRANRVIRDAGGADPKWRGMGTTLAAAVFHDNRVTLGHVGDSRIYRMRAGRLELLTRDDTLLRDQVELGMITAAEASHSRNRSLVTRALGIASEVQPHIVQGDAVPGDFYVLCSDGLNDLVADADIELIVDSLQANLPLAARQLVQAAKDNGGFDNVSVILARVRRPFPAAGRRGWLRRLLAWFRRP
ncbi:MAG: serine/threonine-protein phosphatase [Burkholderiales bacterium]|nr:serine/threonine-protein phosphatase [Burkholderiales bacterium]